MDSSESSHGVHKEDTYFQFHPVPKRAMASFDNLVALANHQERLKEARKMVWRDRGEPAVELNKIWECGEHAGKGGMRAASLAFAIRASFNLVLALIRLRRVRKEYRFTIIRRAIFGEDSFRFAAMLGSFVSIYKFLLNALPILFPTTKSSRKIFSLPTPTTPFDDTSALEMGPLTSIPSPLSATEEVPLAQRRGRLSLTAQAHQVWVRKKTRRWHSVFAGSVAGALAIMFEKNENRTGIAQQLFVRGLQGSYNAFSSKHGIHFPRGEVVVFSVCCAQIMYAFLMAPDTLPRSYTNWITQAGQIPFECVRINKSLVRENSFDIADLDTLIRRDDVTPNNMLQLLALRSTAAAPTPDFGVRYAICPTVHPATDSCAALILPRFFGVFKWMFPVYGALHLIPMILFKRKLFMKNPTGMLLKAGWGTARSSTFLGAFVIIYQSYFCFKHYLHAILTAQKASSPFRLPQSIIDSLISKTSFWYGGLLSGLALLIEEKRRHGELAMYVLPKGLESAWTSAKGHGLVFNTGNHGDSILMAIGMGMVMSTYQNDPHHLSSLVRRVMYQFIGPN
ncbi:hypothetical protein PILCRDRAFT_622510 [Piloderma croceum F 1598]|uniref:Transmembrane protein 135 N-terminal domain-containing protein n=1 Tax=Piloderma croceum (strain F 1598) TaxID=765440 RepID=A0A0C3EXQ7_PILCF|nr:hypothetical protein PILCRDRAFT_622510 [Piloderma croceum F 1598]